MSYAVKQFPERINEEVQSTQRNCIYVLHININYIFTGVKLSQDQK